MDFIRVIVRIPVLVFIIQGTFEILVVEKVRGVEQFLSLFHLVLQVHDVIVELCKHLLLVLNLYLQSGVLLLEVLLVGRSFGVEGGSAELVDCIFFGFQKLFKV